MEIFGFLVDLRSDNDIYISIKTHWAGGREGRREAKGTEGGSEGGGRERGKELVELR